LEPGRYNNEGSLCNFNSEVDALFLFSSCDNEWHNEWRNEVVGLNQITMLRVKSLIGAAGPLTASSGKYLVLYNIFTRDVHQLSVVQQHPTPLPIPIATTSSSTSAPFRERLASDWTDTTILEN
jgi:hypothetical protein